MLVVKHRFSDVFRLKSDSRQGTPVDAILFLERRANMKYSDSAILVSSQSGVLEFWSMFGPLRPRGTSCYKTCYNQHHKLELLTFIFAGSFSAVCEAECTVLSLATDEDNDIFVSGDTAGYVTVWDIREYCNCSLEMAVTKVEIDCYMFMYYYNQFLIS